MKIHASFPNSFEVVILSSNFLKIIIWNFYDNFLMSDGDMMENPEMKSFEVDLRFYG
jgi:hypothetical protein